MLRVAYAPSTPRPRSYTTHDTTLMKFIAQHVHSQSFWICSEKIISQGNHIIMSRPSFPKCFQSTQKQKADIFKFLRFQERLPTAPFSWRITVDSTFKLAENSNEVVDFRFYEPLRETKIGSKIGVVGEIGWRTGLMVSALFSGSSGPGSSPGRGHCVMFLGNTLYSHGAFLHPGA